MQHFGLASIRCNEGKPPHHADSDQWKNGGVDDLVHDAVGEIGKRRIGEKAGGKPAVNEIETHGNNQKRSPDQVQGEIIVPHNGNSTYQTA